MWPKPDHDGSGGWELHVTVTKQLLLYRLWESHMGTPFCQFPERWVAEVLPELHQKGTILNLPSMS